MRLARLVEDTDLTEFEYAALDVGNILNWRAGESVDSEGATGAGRTRRRADRLCAINV